MKAAGLLRSRRFERVASVQRSITLVVVMERAR
jgi:hypothetical protein